VTISPARVEWRNNTAYSTDFDDFYFSMSSAIEERDYVFIEQNNLISRWQALTSGDTFSIAELGFGAGVNFLLCCQRWLATAPDHCILQYYAAESHPLSEKDLSDIIELYPALKSLSDELITKYPPVIEGFHKISLFDDRVHLCLMFGDAEEMFSALAESGNSDYALHNKKPIQSWFLDGFSPAKNPSIWRQSLIHTVATLSSEDTTLSTYSAARCVADGLKAAGFSVEYRKGYGKKRQMIFARAVNNQSGGARQCIETNHWHLNSNASRLPKEAKQVTIIGAGIAGCTTAAAMVARGYQVTVVDRHNKAAQGGSGNKQAVVYPKLSIQRDPLPLINLKAMLYAARFYQPFWHLGLGEQCGVLLLEESDANRQLFDHIADKFGQLPSFVQLINKAEIHQMANIPMDASRALYFPTLGWLSPTHVCEALLNHKQINYLQADIHQIEQDDNSENWLLLDSDHQLVMRSQRLVIANAHDCERFEQTNFFGVKRLRGQITEYPESNSSGNLATVICGDGYITPSNDGRHSIGATYNLGVDNANIRLSDHQANIDQINRTDSALGAMLTPVDIKTLNGRANFRCTTRDYLPIAGPVPKVNHMKDIFAFLRTDARKNSPELGSYHANLYINCGMGSRGLSYAPITAELIADEITHSLSSTERDLRLAMHPARFLIRDLKKKRI